MVGFGVAFGCGVFMFVQISAEVVRVEQHLVGLQQIGPQEEGAAVAELELRDLQLGTLAVDDGPVLAPVELERFPGRKPERNEGPASGCLCLLVLFLSSASGKRRDAIIGAGEAQRTEIRVNLLEGSSLFARPGRLGLEPACELRSKPVELAGAVTFGIGGQDSAGPYVAPDRVSGHAKPFGYLAQRDMIAKVPASDDAQYSHVDHSVSPARCRAGQCSTWVNIRCKLLRGVGVRLNTWTGLCCHSQALPVFERAESA